MRLKILQRLLCRYTLRVRARAPLSHLVPTRKDVQDVRDDEPREEHVPAVHHHEVERVEARDLELEERDHDERRKQTVEVTRREREREEKIRGQRSHTRFQNGGRSSLNNARDSEKDERDDNLIT